MGEDGGPCEAPAPRPALRAMRGPGWAGLCVQGPEGRGGRVWGGQRGSAVEGTRDGLQGWGRAQGVRRMGCKGRCGGHTWGQPCRDTGNRNHQGSPQPARARGQRIAHRPLSPTPHLVQAEPLLSRHLLQRTLGRGRPPSPRRPLPPRRQEQPQEQEGLQGRHVPLYPAGAAGKRRGQAGTAGRPRGGRTGPGPGPGSRLDGAGPGVTPGQAGAP